jgi:hypothetical protein
MLVRRGSAMGEERRNGNNLDGSKSETQEMYSLTRKADLDGSKSETQEMYSLTRKADTPKSVIILE